MQRETFRGFLKTVWSLNIYGETIWANFIFVLVDAMMMNYVLQKDSFDTLDGLDDKTPPSCCQGLVSANRRTGNRIADQQNLENCPDPSRMSSCCISCFINLCPDAEMIIKVSSLYVEMDQSLAYTSHHYSQSCSAEVIRVLFSVQPSPTCGASCSDSIQSC